LRIPGIVERFHPLQVLFSAHVSPRFNSRPSPAPRPASATAGVGRRYRSYTAADRTDGV
jgi:hypothetical protein